MHKRKPKFNSRRAIERRKVLLRQNNINYATKYLEGKDNEIPSTVRFIQTLQTFLDENEIFNAILIADSSEKLSKETSNNMHLTIDYLKEDEDIRNECTNINRKISNLCNVFDYDCIVKTNLFNAKFTITENQSNTLVNKTLKQEDKAVNRRKSRKYLLGMYFFFIMLITLLYLLSL